MSSLGFRRDVLVKLLVLVVTFSYMQVMYSLFVRLPCCSLNPDFASSSLVFCHTVTNTQVSLSACSHAGNRTSISR